MVNPENMATAHLLHVTSLADLVLPPPNPPPDTAPSMGFWFRWDTHYLIVLTNSSIPSSLQFSSINRSPFGNQSNSENRWLPQNWWHQPPCLLEMVRDLTRSLMVAMSILPPTHPLLPALRLTNLGNYHQRIFLVLEELSELKLNHWLWTFNED